VALYQTLEAETGQDVGFRKVGNIRLARNRDRMDVSDLPAVHRDFAFLVDEATMAERIVRAAHAADRGLIANVSVFDVYTGEGIEEGKKSVAIAIRLEPREATLTDPEIDAVAKKVVAAVEKATGATLRG